MEINDDIDNDCAKLTVPSGRLYGVCVVNRYDMDDTDGKLLDQQYGQRERDEWKARNETHQQSKLCCFIGNGIKNFPKTRDALKSSCYISVNDIGETRYGQKNDSYQVLFFKTVLIDHERYDQKPKKRQQIWDGENPVLSVVESMFIHQLIHHLK